MRVKEVSLRHVRMKLISPFSTSFGTFEDKDFLLLEAIDDNGMSGWGESVAFQSPWYNDQLAYIRGLPNPWNTQRP